MHTGGVSLIDVAPHGVALFSIGDLLVIVFALSSFIFLTALSIFGVEIFEVKFVVISGLFGEVTIKSNLLSDVYTVSGPLCVESDVRVITSIGDDLISFFSMMRMKDLFCCFSIWRFVCCKAAARDFNRNDSFGLCF